MTKQSSKESQRKKVANIIDKIDAKLEKIKDHIYEIKDLEYDLLDVFPHETQKQKEE
jgi:hypothetical protein